MKKYLLISFAAIMFSSCKVGHKYSDSDCTYLGEYGLGKFKTIYQPDCDGVSIYNVGEVVYVNDKGEIVPKSDRSKRYTIRDQVRISDRRQ